MLASVSAEVLTLRKRPALWLLGGVWLSLLVFFGYVLNWLTYRSTANPAVAEGILADTLPANLVGNAVAGYALFGGAIVMILGALVADRDYGWGTLKTVLTQRPGRLRAHVGRVGALALALLGLVLVGFALSTGASAIVATAAAKPLDWPGAADVVTGIAAGWLVLGMWCSFGLLLGTLGRGPALAIGSVWCGGSCADAEAWTHVDVDSLLRRVYDTAKQGGVRAHQGRRLPGAAAGAVPAGRHDLHSDRGAGDRRDPAARRVGGLSPRCRVAGRRGAGRGESDRRGRRPSGDGPAAWRLGVLHRHRDLHRPRASARFSITVSMNSAVRRAIDRIDEQVL